MLAIERLFNVSLSLILQHLYFELRNLVGFPNTRARIIWRLHSIMSSFRMIVKSWGARNKKKIDNIYTELHMRLDALKC